MNVGIYIHIPFCKTRCTYCNFSFVVNYPESLPARYTAALLKEIQNFTEWPDAGVDSIYFGGGTPSNIPANFILDLLKLCRERFALSENPEITLEINPDSLSLEKAQAYFRAGINRASVGAQSFDDGELRIIGRSHSSDQIEQAYQRLRRSGFSNISMDLIIGLPGQNWASWRNSLDRVLALHPQHISLYMLEVEPETQLGKDFVQGKIRLPEDDLTAEGYLHAAGRLVAEGYNHYEISNFAQPGFASFHNLKYWQDKPYFGFGASSHAYFGGNRYRNEPDPERYIQKMKESPSGVIERIPLSEERWVREAFYLSLRRLEGVDLKKFRESYGVAIEITHAAPIARLVEAGLLTMGDERIRLTPKGVILSNEVFQEFL